MAKTLNHAGITDLYERYEYTHPSDVGMSLGSGMASSAQMFKDHRDEKEVQGDILQEMLVLSPTLGITDTLSHSFINTTVVQIDILPPCFHIHFFRERLCILMDTNSEI
jgi:hypothetical protein